jgi:hypothetical protein
MIHSADDFRRHVARGAAGFLWIVGFSFPGHSEIS